MTQKTAIYPGAFDPITYGHLDVVKRALKIFDRIIIAVFESPVKPKILFSPDERVSMIMDAIKSYGLDTNVIEVEKFSGLLVDHMKKKNVHFIVRGLRAISDFDVEFQMAAVNKDMDNSIETILMPTDKKYFYLNSTLVKDLAKYGGQLGEFVPKNVEAELRKKFSG
ncbi:MAG: pantetheine-phosphate adenylyltransferase [Candidatus Aenigmatarchaeota archaeon]